MHHLMHALPGRQVKKTLKEGDDSYKPLAGEDHGHDLHQTLHAHPHLLRDGASSGVWLNALEACTLTPRSAAANCATARGHARPSLSRMAVRLP